MSVGIVVLGRWGNTQNIYVSIYIIYIHTTRLFDDVTDGRLDDGVILLLRLVLPRENLAGRDLIGRAVPVLIR